MGPLRQPDVRPRTGGVSLPQLRIARVREHLVHAAASHHVAAQEHGHQPIAHPTHSARPPAARRDRRPGPKAPLILLNAARQPDMRAAARAAPGIPQPLRTAESLGHAARRPNGYPEWPSTSLRPASGTAVPNPPTPARQNEPSALDRLGAGHLALADPFVAPARPVHRPCRWPVVPRSAGERRGHQPAPARPRRGESRSWAGAARPGSWPRSRLGVPVPAAAAPKPARLPEDECRQIDNSALPGRLTAGAGRDGWTGPGNHVDGRSGRDAAHVPWFYGFRLAIRTELGSRIVRAWSIVPAAFNGREIAEELLGTGRPRVTAGGQGKVITRWGTRIEATFGESTGQVGSPATTPTPSGPADLHRVAATKAAHTLMRAPIAAVQINPHNAPEARRTGIALQLTYGFKRRAGHVATTGPPGACSAKSAQGAAALPRDPTGERANLSLP
jgi:hypothetical protein